MTPTLASIQADLIDRVGAALAFVGKDGATVQTPNAGLAQPILWALRVAGVPPAGASPADADFAALSNSGAGLVADLAEVRTLESVLNALTGDDVTYQLGINKFDLSDYQDRLEKTIARRWESLRARYGIGLGTIVGGTIDAGFAEPATASGSEF